MSNYRHGFKKWNSNLTAKLTTRIVTGDNETDQRKINSKKSGLTSQIKMEYNATQEIDGSLLKLTAYQTGRDPDLRHDINDLRHPKDLTH